MVQSAEVGGLDAKVPLRFVRITLRKGSEFATLRYDMFWSQIQY